MYLLSLTSRCWYFIMSATLPVCKGPKECFAVPMPGTITRFGKIMMKSLIFFYPAELETLWVKKKFSGCPSTKKAQTTAV